MTPFEITQSRRLGRKAGVFDVSLAVASPAAMPFACRAAADGLFELRVGHVDPDTRPLTPDLEGRR